MAQVFIVSFEIKQFRVNKFIKYSWLISLIRGHDYGIPQAIELIGRPCNELFIVDISTIKKGYIFLLRVTVN